jgi:signal transduction histidine kinase
MPTQENKKRGQLRDTFIFLFVLIACIPILGLGTVSLLSIAKAHRNSVSELEHQTLINTSETVSLFFHDITETLSTNFDTLDKNAMESATSNWKDVYVQKFAESNKAILEVSLISEEGKEVAKYSKISTSTILLRLSELPLIQEARKGGIVISNVHTTPQGQTVSIAAPWIIDGKINSVVLAEVSLTPLTLSLEKTRLGKSGYVRLFDKEGTLIGSKNNQLSGITFLSWERLQNVLQGTKFDGLSQNDRYVSVVSSLPVISSATRIQDINWALFVEWPVTEADTIIENFRNTVLVTVFVSVIAVLLLALFMAHRLIVPIKTLQSAANEIEKGNFEKQVSIKTDDELEELGDSFNTMSLGLKRLEELKNEFVYVAAHELRSPVTAIKGYLELVFDGNGGTLTPEMEHLLSPVRRSNDRLVNLVNDLLQVARSEAGKLEITSTPSEITKEVSAILDEVRPLAQKRNITILYSPQEKIPLVDINTGSFKEIIMNFVSNAIKYGNDDGTVTVTHEIQDNMISTSIADNGRGMSEEDQKHLFEKFFRAGDVKKTSIEGTGLGLFITKELVEKMGGELRVTSKLGEGTTFTVLFKQSAIVAIA